MEGARRLRPQLPQVVPMGNVEEPLHRCQGVELEPDGRRVLGSHHGDHKQQAALPQLHDQGDRQGQDDDQGDPQRWFDAKEGMHSYDGKG
eukprot:10554010-Heterocapsa_arctica.AAC.1